MISAVALTHLTFNVFHCCFDPYRHHVRIIYSGTGVYVLDIAMDFTIVCILCGICIITDVRQSGFIILLSFIYDAVKLFTT